MEHSLAQEGQESTLCFLHRKRPSPPSLQAKLYLVTASRSAFHCLGTQGGQDPQEGTYKLAERDEPVLGKEAAQPCHSELDS